MLYRFSELMQRIFKYGDIPNNSLTRDKELNILMYWSPSHVITYRSYTLLKMVRFFGPPCIYISLGFRYFFEIWFANRFQSLKWVTSSIRKNGRLSRRHFDNRCDIITPLGSLIWMKSDTRTWKSQSSFILLGHSSGTNARIKIT